MAFRLGFVETCPMARDPPCAWKHERPRAVGRLLWVSFRRLDGAIRSFRFLRSAAQPADRPRGPLECRRVTGVRFVRFVSHTCDTRAQPSWTRSHRVMRARPAGIPPPASCRTAAASVAVPPPRSPRLLRPLPTSSEQCARPRLLRWSRRCCVVCSLDLFHLISSSFLMLSY